MGAEPARRGLPSTRRTRGACHVDDDVFIGIDVGKSEHWATALTRRASRTRDRPLPNDEARSREVYEHLGEHGLAAGGRRLPATHRGLRRAVARARTWATRRAATCLARDEAHATCRPGLPRGERDAAVIRSAPAPCRTR